ncbi:MAG: hypothetical protein AABW79_02535 [Nanoarchaeota archaeon]
MATITINVKTEINDEFRNIVKMKFGEGKGKLGKAIEDAIKKWIAEQRQKSLSERQIKIMRDGLWSQKNYKFNRDEIYERS